VQHFSSVEALIESGDLQALCVCGPEDAHAGPVLAALERGIAVLVEKPLASTLEDCARMCAAAVQYGALLSVGHLLRYDYRYAQIEAAVRRGDLGELQSLHARRWNTKSAQQRLHGRSSLPLFLGVHDYDVVRWIAGAEPVRVVAEGRSRVLAAQGYAIEDTSIALISFANGVLACVEEGWIMPEGHPSGFVQKLDALGDGGMMSLEGSMVGLMAVSDTRVTWPDAALWPPDPVSGVGGSLERQVRHFVRCVADHGAPLATGQDGLAAVRIALAVEESARTGAAVGLG
jgi:predicted dehydrogenase